jgi:RNA polymerase-binding transcription factor DksA
MPSAKKADDTTTSPAKQPSATKAAPAKTSTAKASAKAPAAKAPAAKAPARKTATTTKAAASKASPAKPSAGRSGAGKDAAGAREASGAVAKGAAPSKRAAAPEPAAEVLGGGPEFLAAQRALLLEEREAHTRQAAGLRAEAEQLAEERDPGDVQFDEESGQGDTMNVERERDLALSAQAMQQVLEIDAALDKIDKGTYGLCERCGKPIPEERLQALPWAALDVGCKSMGFARR